MVQREEAEHDVVGFQIGGVRGEELEDVGDEIEVREHHALGESRSAARIGQGGESFGGWLVGNGKGGSSQLQQIGKRSSSSLRGAGGVNVAQAGQSGEVDVGEKWTVADEDGGAGVFQLIADLALAVHGIEERGDGPRERGGVVGDAEFPGIGRVNGDDFARLQAGGDESASGGRYQLSVVGVGDAAIGRRVHDGGLAGMTPARVEDKVVEETVVGIGVEALAQHESVAGTEYLVPSS